jgi:hypothetical protein
MTIIGRDNRGVTQISLDALRKLSKEKELQEVLIYSRNGDPMCQFVFKDNTGYEATGFAIGYGGTGPNGLHQAIRLFDAYTLPADFWRSGIQSLDSKKDWIYLPGSGFIPMNDYVDIAR